MTDPFRPTPFGRYYLTELIARGGMAGLYRAKLFGAGGFEKTIAVKKVLPQFSDHQEFLTMLSDEARLTVSLTHPNIVQLFDFGKIGNDYFIAMEFVEGVDLKALLTRMQDRSQKIPVDIACYIMEEVCRGLQYAHAAKDGGGKPLGIVHRDISPQNILLSFNGEVKVTDFGIAKAASNITHTQTGMIKGKVAYMSPEQADGLDLDGRTDIFAAGLVLVEMLTQKLLFDGDSQFEILGKIKATHINPEMLPSAIPPELRVILANSLAHNVNDRLATAAEFQKALRRFMTECHAGTSAETVAHFLRGAFVDVIEAREGRLEPPIDPRLKAELAAQSGGMAIPEISIDSATATEVTEATKVTTTGAILRSARRISWPLFGVSLVLFFFADFFKPLLWLSPILMLLSAGTAITLYLASIKRYLTVNPLVRVLRSRVGESFVFALISAIVWGVATLISAFTPPQGLLAANIPPVGTLQEQLFRLKSELSGLKGELAKLEKTAAIVPNPKTPEEFYHNARQYQLQGKTGESIAAYGEFLKREPNDVDVHQTYQTQLQTAEGVEKVKAAYDGLKKQFPDNPVVAAMAARLLPEAERITMLDEWTQKNKDPYLIYERLKVFLDRGLGFLTTTEWIKAKALYDELMKGDGPKILKTHFLDSEVLEKAMQGLTTFDIMYAKFGSLRAKNPIMINHEQYLSGVSVTILPQEASVKKILYAVDNPKTFSETGVDPNVQDITTGDPSVRNQIHLTIPPGRHTLYAKYIDSHGTESTVKEYPLEVLPFFVQIDMLSFEPSDTVRGFTAGFQVMKGFTIKEFDYSIDAETFNHKVQGDKVTITDVPRGVHTLNVRGILPDGKPTAVWKSPLYLN